MRINLVTGGAGCLDSQLIDRLMKSGDEVIDLDNCLTGREFNISRWIGHSRFSMISDNNLKPILKRDLNPSALHPRESLYSSSLIAHFCKTFSTL